VTTTAPVQVLTPRSGHEAHALMRELIASAAPVRIAGAGTWRGAGAPVASALTLSLRELSGIVEYVPGDLTLTALAGTSLAELAHATAAHGQWIGLDPAGDRHGTIGATIATASSGPLAHAFGTPRDLVLGLDAITGYGDVVRPGGRVVKNVAGFDLVRLYTGAWGTLGPITQVTLRLRALPVHDVTLAMPAGQAAQLGTLIAKLRANTIAPLACEWIDGATAQQLRIGHGNDTILLRVGGNDPFVRGQQAALSALGSCTPCDPTVWGALAALDEQAPIVLRLSGAVSDLPARLEHIRTALTRERATFTLHASVGRGTIRVIVSDPGANGRAALQATVIGEHRNVERLPQAWWTTEPDPMSDGLAARIRRAFDPQLL
jgi:glycolate oxidase FAD binding subunit